jgi:hypothetical protein
MAEGLRIDPGWVSKYGPASYLGMEGDKRSASFYGGLGRGRTPTKSSVVVGDLKLDNPLVVSGRDDVAIRRDLIEKLGGPARVAADVTKMYDEDVAVVKKIQREELVETKPGALNKVLASDPTEVMYWDFEQGSVERMDQRVRVATNAGSMYNLEKLKAYKDVDRVEAFMSNSVSSSNIDSVLGDVARRRGHDALVVHDTHGFTPAVGGSQVVLFEPAKFKPTGVKGLKDFLTEN